MKCLEQRKVTEIENNNFVKLITLFLQNMQAQKEINVKIRYFQKIKSNEFIFPAVTETDMNISSSQLEICDLLREKGPTAVKRRFKTQLTAFSL